MHVLVVSDTHLLDAMRLPSALIALAERAAHIVHAGDHSVLDVVRVLERFAPVTAVHGNVEQPEVFEALPAESTVVLEGVRVGVVHDAGGATGRHRRLEARFSDCEVVVYGHSHMPEACRSETGVWIVNPGSPTQRRRASFHSAAWLELEPGRCRSAAIVDLDAERT